MIAVIAADTLGLPASAIRPEIGDTMFPISGASGGSTTAAAVSPRRAHRDASTRSTRSRTGSRRRSASTPATLVAAGGRIQVKDKPSKGLSWADACKQLGTAADLRSTATGSPGCRR